MMMIMYDVKRLIMIVRFRLGGRLGGLVVRVAAAVVRATSAGWVPVPC